MLLAVLLLVPLPLPLLLLVLLPALLRVLVLTFLLFLERRHQPRLALGPQHGAPIRRPEAERRVRSDVRGKASIACTRIQVRP